MDMEESLTGPRPREEKGVKQENCPTPGIPESQGFPMQDANDWQDSKDCKSIWSWLCLGAVPEPIRPWSSEGKQR